VLNFTGGLAQLLAGKSIRANTVAPGPIWTPLIPSTMPEDAVAKFGKQVPMQRPGQPSELATTYVMLADPLSSYVSGATIAVTGGKAHFCKDGAWEPRHQRVETFARRNGWDIVKQSGRIPCSTCFQFTGAAIGNPSRTRGE
jgi:Enoyl-(Acyl carrier protein) reductase